MSDDFSPLGGNGKAPVVSWSPTVNASSIFVPYPATTQTAVPEVGYDEGGYGEGGYDAPAISATTAPTTNWVNVSSK